jgi:hypothetical protein
MGLEVREEGFDEVKGGDVVGVHFGGDGGEVDGCGVGEIEGALDSGVENYTIKTGMLFDNSDTLC